MAEPTIEITVNKPRESVKVEATIIKHALVPPWIFGKAKCDKCNMEFHDFMITVVETKYYGIRLLHTNCYERILTY